MQSGLFRKGRKLCTKTIKIKSSKSVKKKQTSGMSLQWDNGLSVGVLFCCVFSDRRKIIFSNGSEITCFTFYFNPVNKITFTRNVPRHQNTKLRQIFILCKNCHVFCLRSGCQTSTKHSLHNVIYSCNGWRNFKSRSTSSRTNRSKTLSLAAVPKSLRTRVQ